jgi:uncharacterized protein
VTTHPADEWRTRLRGQLLAARKERDAVRTSALRSALAAIDNAETPDGAQLDAQAGGTIAGGLGAAEVTRRRLTDEQIRTLLRTEIDGTTDRGRRVHHGRSRAACQIAARRGCRAHRPAGRCLTRVRG